MKTMDEATILRFASGELDAEEESTFLARCEIAPESWREAVLAVATHRRMVEALGDLAAADAPSPAARPTRREPGRWRWAAVAAALAAGLLLGIAGTRMTGFGPGREGQVVTAPEAPQNGPAPEAEPAVKRAPDAAAKTVALNPAGSDVPRSIPADVLQQMPPSLSEAQRAALGKHGFQVEEEEPTLYVIDAGNGTRWAVPTQRTMLHYVKQ